MRRLLLCLAVASSLVLILTACTSSQESGSTAPATTATTTATTSAAAKAPWRVVWADDDPGSMMLPGNLVVGVDFGREITRDEQTEFRDKASIIDGKGNACQCMATMTAGSITTTKQGKTYEFGPTVFFAFSVETGSPKYSFKFEDWPLVDLGDPSSKAIYSP